MRAPPRRVAEKSKWLREEGDEDWGGKYGKNNSFQDIPKNQLRNSGKLVISKQNVRVYNLEGAVYKDRTKPADIIQKAGDFSNVINIVGPTSDELTGLDLEERKRKRVGPYTDAIKVSNIDVSHPDSVLSNEDCADSNKTLLATLAKQASQSL